jgi:pyruvate/2-oxoglutarate dehydrogenase complex dihydrolipoamide acyltransferase (E2) component
MQEQALPIVPAIVSQDVPHEELMPLTPARRLIGKRMLQSITTAPHIYLDLEIDMTEAERCCRSIGRSMEAQGEPALSLTALIVRATAAAIVLHPNINSAFEEGALEGKDAIRQRQKVHIGIAVDTERALLTPVIRNAHQLNVTAISRELRRLTLAARQETLVPDELAGATFTISNLGMYDIDTFHAIIVPGQSAILAVGKVTKRGVVIEDGDEARLEIRPVMKVSLSADHRVLDGAAGSRFLHQLKMFLENPYLLL